MMLEAEFLSPLVQHLPDLLPKESQMARFQMILPKTWPDSKLRPTCLHLAGTGDHVCYSKHYIIIIKQIRRSGFVSLMLDFNC